MTLQANNTQDLHVQLAHVVSQHVATKHDGRGNRADNTKNADKANKAKGSSDDDKQWMPHVQDAVTILCGSLIEAVMESESELSATNAQSQQNILKNQVQYWVGQQATDQDALSQAIQNAGDSPNFEEQEAVQQAQNKVNQDQTNANQWQTTSQPLEHTSTGEQQDVTQLASMFPNLIQVLKDSVGNA